MLVVDDHEPNVILLERLLRDAGADPVDVLMDARKVVAHCLEQRPDLMLLDLYMPHMDACAVLQALDVALPAGTGPPVLVITADPSVEARDIALGAGAQGVLTKPLDLRELLQEVRSVLDADERSASRRARDH